jgi:small basic protein (TIGR04137 family)
MPRRSGNPAEGEKENLMSLHSSLKSASKIATKRNVLKRFERVDLLKQRGKWKDGDRAYGLPKTKPQ